MIYGPFKPNSNKVDFPDVILNFSKILCGLPSTLFLTGELWPLRFIWHHDLRVTHCESSAMTFVFTQYSFCNSFRQGILPSLQVLNNFLCVHLFRGAVVTSVDRFLETDLDKKCT